MLLRLAYLGLTNTFALLRLIPMSSRDKTSRSWRCVTRSQCCNANSAIPGCGSVRPTGRYSPRSYTGYHASSCADSVCLVRPDTILRWHRDLLRRHHGRMSRPKRPGRPRTIRSIRVLVLRLAKENTSWGYRRSPGELLVLGIKVAASTVWQILTDAGIDPAPERASTTWVQFLRS